VTSQDLFVEIAKTALNGHSLAEERVLACMIVLHTCDFVLTNDCMLDDVVWPTTSKTKKLHAVTRRHAAEIIAAATGHESDQGVIDKWYAAYSSRSPYEVLESVPDPLRGLVEQCRADMLQHPALIDIVEAE
jgi:hypothetical protein